MEELPPSAESRPAVESALRDIQAIEERAADKAKLAKQELADKHAEKAIKLFEEVYSEWPGVPGSEDAQSQRQKLIVKQIALQQALDLASKAEVDFTKYQILEGAEKDFPEFEKIADVKKKVLELRGKLDGIDKAIADAQALMSAGDKTKARLAFKDLLKNNLIFLQMKKVTIRVPITSTPDG